MIGYRKDPCLQRLLCWWESILEQVWVSLFMEEGWYLVETYKNQVTFGRLGFRQPPLPLGEDF